METAKSTPTEMVIHIPILDIPQGKFYGGAKSINIDTGTEMRPLYERIGDGIKYVQADTFKNGKLVKIDKVPDHKIVDDSLNLFAMMFENGRYGVIEKHRDDCLDVVWFKVAQFPRGTKIDVQ